MIETVSTPQAGPGGPCGRTAALRSRAACRAAVVFVALLLAVRAAAQPARRIVVVRSPVEHALNGAVRNELRTLGWDVALVDPSVIGVSDGRAGAAGASLEGVARPYQASAVVRIGQDRIDLWIADPSTGQTALQETVLVGNEMTPDVAALHAVEVLRARLMKLGFVVESPAHSMRPPSEQPRRGGAAEAPAETTERETSAREGAGAPSGDRSAGGESPPGGDAAADGSHGGPPSPGDAASGPSRSRLWLGVGPAVGASGLGISLQGQVSGRVELSHRTSIGALLVWPTLPSTVSAAPGSAKVIWGLAAIAINASLSAPAGGRWLLGVGVGAVGVRVRGRAEPPFADRVVNIPAGAGLFRAAWIHPFSERLAVRLELIAGATVPRPVVRLDERVEASFGQPFGLGSVTLEVGGFP